MTDKNELRIQAKNIRKNLNIKKISAVLVNLIRQNEVYQNSKHVMLFYPTEFEIDLRDLFNDNKNFYLPRVNEENLLVCPFDYNTNLKKSYFGIYEPCSNPVAPEILDLVIVPALIADKNGYRLGYGGGFYDKFISKYGKNFKTICAVPKELFTDKLPVCEFDQKVDIVITN